MSAGRPFLAWVASTYPDPSDALAAFLPDAQAAAAEVGALLADLPTLDGRWHYMLALDGKRDRRQSYIGEYRTHPDGTVWPQLTFKSQRHGGSAFAWNPRDLAWSDFQAAANDNTPTDDARQARAATYRQRAADLAAEAAARQAQRDAQEAAGHEAAATVAAAILAASLPYAGHAYLTRKNVQAHGLRVAAADLRARLWDGDRSIWRQAIAVRSGDLLVPMVDASGRLWNVQRIDAEGVKRFLLGGRKRGTLHRIDGQGAAWMAEGFATAATVHAATGAPVVVAFDAGNLAPVAADLAGQVQAVAADHDDNGAGLRAAAATGLPYSMPPTCGQDWNDYAAAHGLQAVADALVAGLVEAVPPPSPGPRLALPVFSNLAALPRIELAGREQTWWNRLAAQTDPLQAAAMAWAICRSRAVTIPTQTTLDELVASIELQAAAMLHPETVATMRRALARWTNQRQRRALSQVTLSPEVLRRHRHEVHAELPELEAADYAGVVLLWAPMGSGKTQRIGKPFAAHARRLGRVVATCHRRSLVAELANRLQAVHYADVDRETAYGVDALATCLPSITKAAHAQVVDECRYLFVDEIAQVLRFLEADKACRTDDGTNADVYQRLRGMVAAAHCVIGADAGMDDRVVRFLEDCRPEGERFRIIEVRAQQAAPLTVHHGYGDDALAAVYGEASARLADGQRLWIGCESEKRVAEVARLLERTGKRVLALTASNKGNTAPARFWQDPETVSLEYDAVVHSPVISSGLSIEHRDAGPHFDHGLFIGGGHAITPADAAQMMRRVRYLRSWSVAFIANSARGQADADAMLLGMEAAAAVEGIDGAAVAASSFDAFVAGVRADNAMARGDFAAGLLWVLERQGFTLAPLETDAAADADMLALLREELTAERRAAVLDAPDLDDDSARRLRNAEHRTQADSHALTKHAVRKALGLDLGEVTDAALDVWDEGRGPRRLDRFSALQGLAGRDQAAAHMTHRRFYKARVWAYRTLFAGIDVAPGLRVDDDMAELLVRRVIEHRHLLVWLGIAPGRFAASAGRDRDGVEKEFPMPKAPQKDVGEVFRAMGLELKRKRNEWAGTKCYEVESDAWRETEAWAERRSSATCCTNFIRQTGATGAINLIAEGSSIRRRTPAVPVPIGLAAARIRIGAAYDQVHRLLGDIPPGVDGRLTLRQYRQQLAA